MRRIEKVCHGDPLFFSSREFGGHSEESNDSVSGTLTKAAVELMKATVLESALVLAQQYSGNIWAGQ